jgi:hypothetical protein
MELQCETSLPRTSTCAGTEKIWLRARGHIEESCDQVKGIRRSE